MHVICWNKNHLWISETEERKEKALNPSNKDFALLHVVRARWQGAEGYPFVLLQ